MAHTLVIHGGAGNITPAMMTKDDEQAYTKGLQAAFRCRIQSIRW